jgi:hypothetical protein
MLTNQAKNQRTVDGLSLKLHPRGGAEWDGLSRWLVDYLAENPTTLEKAPEPHRSYIRRWLTATKAALEADD